MKSYAGSSLNFGSSLILSQCSCYMPPLAMTPAVFPMFQRLVLPFKLFLKIFLGLLYYMFTLICQSYRSFPRSLFRHDFSFLNNVLLFLRDALTCRHCVCFTCANEKSNVFRSVAIQVKVPLGVHV